MLPGVRLDTERFEAMVEEARTMIAGIYPEWTDYNYHDPGMTFLELFAWLKENQQFFMEQLGPSHYEQFFRLLGFRRKERRPARLLACPQSPLSCRIPKGSRFEAAGMIYETVQEENLVGDSLQRVWHRGPGPLAGDTANHHQLSCMGEMCFYPFGQRPGRGEECLFFFSEPLKPETTFHLFCQVAEERLKIRNPLGKEKFYPLVRISWSYYDGEGFLPATVLEDKTEGFLFSGRITFSIDGRMAPFPGSSSHEEYVIRAVLEEGEYDLPPVLSGVSMNHILLVQKRTWPKEREPFVIGEGNGFPGQEYALPWKKPIASSVRLEAEDVLCPGHFQEWKRVEDFSECTPSDRCFVVEEEQGVVRFGDGYYGMPPEGKIRLLSLEETNGSRGNIKTKTELCRKDSPGEERFVCYLELERGRDRETMEEALFRLGTGHSEDLRVVTARDYEKRVKETPGLILYSCKVLDLGHRENQVMIVVRPGDGKRNLPLSFGYQRNILQNLEKRRLIGTQIRLCAPEYIELRVYLEISAMPQYRQAKEMVLKELREWFEELGACFGRTVSYGNLYGRIDSMPCVKRLRVLSLEAKSGQVSRNPGGDLIPPANGVFLPGQVEYTEVVE